MLFPDPAFLTDGTAAMMVSLAMFVVPGTAPQGGWGFAGCMHGVSGWCRRLCNRRAVGAEASEVASGVREEDGIMLLLRNVEGVQDGVSHGRESPETRAEGSQRAILDEKAIMEVPWNVVMLLGGGFALAEASRSSGLAGGAVSVTVFKFESLCAMHGWCVCVIRHLAGRCACASAGSRCEPDINER